MKIQEIFSNIFKKSTESEKYYLKDGIYLTETVTFGRDKIIFVDENRRIRKTIVDSYGRIHRFPGIIKEDFWVNKVVTPKWMEPKINFRTSFEEKDDKWMVLWEIQPDGRYWEDEDGFGGTNDEEITLFTHVDENGDFTGPFRVYQSP